MGPVEAVEAGELEEAVISTASRIAVLSGALAGMRSGEPVRLPAGLPVVRVQHRGRALVVSEELLEEGRAAGDAALLWRIREALVECLRGLVVELDVEVSTGGSWARRGS